MVIDFDFCICSGENQINHFLDGRSNNFSTQNGLNLALCLWMRAHWAGKFDAEKKVQAVLSAVHAGIEVIGTIEPNLHLQNFWLSEYSADS